MPVKRKTILPGFGLTTGFALTYLSLFVLIPLSAVFLEAATQSWQSLWATISSPRLIASYKLTLGAAFISALFNAFLGLLVAWVLARYDFPGKRIADAVVDLPFALPTAVAGLSLTALYSPNGWFGHYLGMLGIQVAYTRLGVLIALIFVGLPFVVRNVQPVLEDFDLQVEEAARSLGATRWQTFARVIAPALLPSLLTGLSLAFARALGEYGSVVFISGNRVFETEITSFMIMNKLDQHDVPGATAIATLMLVASFVLLLAINLLQARSRRYMETS
ncbi:MAG TPA: sulfate ABC transporter permease subunit CysT [Terriglobia bacterium]|nr:sulfate ABC transporter permease subunit CysT [Terriglobia bacterium]